jgi:hypothetical protein
MDVPFNEIYKKQTKTLIPASQKKAVLSAINIASRRVDIYFVNNPQTIVKNIPVASSFDIQSARVGDICKIDVFDESNPRDMIVAYSYRGSTNIGFNGVVAYVKDLDIYGNPVYGTLNFNNGILTAVV